MNTTPPTCYRIIREGYFFRAVETISGRRSDIFTSPSQAGRYIQRKAGADAHRDAYDAFVAALAKVSA